MEPLLYVSMGAAGVIGLIILRLAARHGWAWVEARIKAKIKAKATAAEADVRAKFAAAAAPFEARIAALEQAVANIKTKVGA